MNTLRGLVHRLVKEESGVTMIEYALLAALIAIAAIATVTALGTAVNKEFHNIANTINN